MAGAKHLIALDGLRAVAITSVILYHTRLGSSHSGAVDRLLYILTGAGWCGVDLFFVLSGFLITGILLDAKGRGRFFRNFYIRRTLRIFPLYYLVLFVVLVVLPHVLPTDDPGVQRILDHQAGLWTYATNIEVLRASGWIYSAGWIEFTHLWSLAIEEQFYLVWPLLVFLLPRRALVALAVALVVVAPIVRVAMLEGHRSVLVVYSFTICRIDTLAIGSLLAVLVRAAPARVLAAARAMLVVGASGVVGVIAMARDLDFDAWTVQTVGYSMLGLFFGGVVLLATRPSGAIRRVLANPALVLIGRYSYGLYIFHYALMPLYRRMYDVEAIGVVLHSRLAAQLGFTVLVFAASTATAALSWHLIEQRFILLKDRWAPTSTSR